MGELTRLVIGMMYIDNCDDILIALMMMMMTLTEARLSIRYSTHFFYPFVGNANFDDCNGLAMDMTMMMVMKKVTIQNSQNGDGYDDDGDVDDDDCDDYEEEEKAPSRTARLRLSDVVRLFGILQSGSNLLVKRLLS